MLKSELFIFLFSKYNSHPVSLELNGGKRLVMIWNWNFLIKFMKSVLIKSMKSVNILIYNLLKK